MSFGKALDPATGVVHGPAASVDPMLEVHRVHLLPYERERLFLVRAALQEPTVPAGERAMA